MSAIFGYQYVDSDPDEVEKQNKKLGLDESILLFDNFPWEEQFEKIEKRDDLEITSTVPAVYFYKTENHYLSISGIDDEGFTAKYIKDDTIGQLFIPNDVRKQPHGITVTQIIGDFFNGKIADLLESFSIDPESKEVIEYQMSYSLAQVFSPLLYMVLPYAALLLDDGYFPESFTLIMVASGGILIVASYHVYLRYSYWKNDRYQKITLAPKNKTLTINRKGISYSIHKSDVKSCDLIHTTLRDSDDKIFDYLRIKTEDETFIITRLTLDGYALVYAWNIHFREVHAIFPKIERFIETEKQKRKRQTEFEKQKTQFLRTYADWDNDRLNKVVSDPDYYADFAIAAAEEILAKRQERIK